MSRLRRKARNLRAEPSGVENQRLLRAVFVYGSLGESCRRWIEIRIGRRHGVLESNIAQIYIETLCLSMLQSYNSSTPHASSEKLVAE